MENEKTLRSGRSWRKLLGLYFLATSCISPVIAKAQTGSGSSPLSSTPPSFQTVDSQGVDLASGNLNLSAPLINIGNGDSEIAWSYQVRGNITADNKIPTLSSNIASIDVSGSIYLKINRSAILFSFEKYLNGNNSNDGTMYKPKYGKFGKLLKYTIPTMTRTFKTGSGTSSFSSTVKYVYIDKSGAEYTFYYFPALPNGNYVDNIKFPNGNVERYYYDYLNGSNADHDINNIVISVENSYGMQIKNLNHHAYSSPSGSGDATVSTVALNKAYVYCNPEVYACSAAQGWPKISIYDKYTVNSSPSSVNNYSSEYVELTDRLSNKLSFNYSGLGATQHVVSYNTLGPVSSIIKNISYNVNANGYYSTVSSVSHADPTSGGNISHGYSYTVASGSVSATATDPLNRPMTIVTNSASGLPLTTTDKLGKVVTYTYDASGNVQSMTRQDGSSAVYTYDDRGNVTYILQNPASNSGLSSTHLSFGYDTECTNYVKCNKPNWTRDSLENETDFTYNQDGFVESVTGPAPMPGGVRPQTRYYYVKLQAYYLNSSGSISASGQPITLLSKTSQCLTQAGASLSGVPGQGPFILTGTAACQGTSDERVETIDYGPQQNGVANNLWPIRKSIQSGDGSIVSSTGYTYDNVGNVIAQDGPLPGTADTTVYIYDTARQLTGVIGPDPDGVGPRKNSALRYIYGKDGQVVQANVGTVDSQANTSWSTFSSLQQFNIDYDSLGRPVASKLVNSGIVSITQYSYDLMDRLDCLAVRMNSGVWNSLPTSACTLQTAGSVGPDRITKYAYDAADRRTKVTSGYGTPEQADEMTTVYADNGQIASITDGKGNVTNYGYDGLYRLTTTSYPGGSYEQFDYDLNSNVISHRLRDGLVIGYGYDALNRLTTVDRPTGEDDSSLSYDLFGNPTVVTKGTTLTNSYDALGRLKSEGQAFGTMSYKYDEAGRRTRVTWQDDFYVSYDYLTTGEVSAIRDSAGNAIVSFGYDDLGQRTSLSRANGTVTSYSYDPASRLTQLVQDLAGTGGDLTVGYGYNPAGQISSRNASNSAYVWNGHANVNRNHIVNGLNQYTTAGTANFSYDLRGNLTGDGAHSYSYTIDNLLKASSGGVSLFYDPAGRLHEYDTNVSTRMVYDGAHLSAEIANPSGAILRRYVYGPRNDEPLIWYEGSGTGDRRWLHADERGSIVAITNDSGNAIAFNSYDEYGIPGKSNYGLFQYTGQKWLPKLDLYDYKARMYSATLGRFMQADPIGYGDGMNWYAYTGNDPMNKVDPSGLVRVCPTDNSCYDDGTDGTIVVTAPGGETYNDSGWFSSGFDYGSIDFGQLVSSSNLLGSFLSNEQGAPQNNCGNGGSGSVRDFLWGAGDVALLGFGDELRDALGIDPVDMNSTAYTAGEITGSVALLATGVGGGIRAAGAAARGLEFSHFIPARMGGARSIWNGNFVSTATHALSDPFRYRFMPRSWKAANPMPNRASQLWTRTPNTAKGTAAGAGAAGTGLANAGC